MSKRTKPDLINLVIEKGDDTLWGRVEYEDDLIIETGDTIEQLKSKLKKALVELHGIPAANIQFDLVYDLTSVFDQKKYLNISAVADEAGINPALMRQYASGQKKPSLSRARDIEKVLHRLAEELSLIRLTVVTK